MEESSPQENDFSKEFRMINTFGHWSGDEDGLRDRLRGSLSRGVLLLTWALMVCEVISVRNYFGRGDLQAGLVNLNELLSALQCINLLCTFLVFRQEIRSVVALIEDLTADVLEEVDDPMVRQMLANRRRRCLIAYRLFFWSFIMICHWALTPILNFFIHGQTGVIVHAWLPFDNDTTVGFFSNFFLELIPCVSFCLCLLMFGSVFISMSEHILGQLEILAHRLSNIKYGEEGSQKELVRCVKHHERILRVIQLFQQFSAYPLIIFCLLTILVLCVILFEITCVETTTSVRMINLLEEAQQEFLMIATYCWYTNEITLQSRELVRAGYMSNWYEGTPSEKRTLLNLMTRTTLPGFFGGFLRLDLLTFINIFKAAFSYYNFLAAVSSQQHSTDRK